VDKIKDEGMKIEQNQSQENKKRGRPKMVKPEVAEETKPQDIKKMETKRDEWPDIKVLKDWDKVDPLRLTASDPEYAYRWLRDKSDNISLKTSNDPVIGYWKLVPAEHLNGLETRFGVKIERAGDGLCRKGDLILAYMPKKFHDEKLKIKQEKARRPLEAVDKMLKGGIPGAVPGIGGIQTEKQLGMEGKNYKR